MFSIYKKFLTAILLFFFLFILVDPSQSQEYSTCRQHDAAVVQENNSFSESDDSFSIEEILACIEDAFGKVSQDIAKTVENIFSEYGKPNGYIVGDDIGVAIFGGLHYGKGTFYTRNKGNYQIFWQGPSIGWDIGISSQKTMFLVYGLQSVEQMYERYIGVEGNLSVIAGGSTMLLYKNPVTIIPLRFGWGLRLGVSAGYLKFTTTPASSPF